MRYGVRRQRQQRVAHGVVIQMVAPLSLWAGRRTVRFGLWLRGRIAGPDGECRSYEQQLLHMASLCSRSFYLPLRAGLRFPLP